MRLVCTVDPVFEIPLGTDDYPEPPVAPMIASPTSASSTSAASPSSASLDATQKILSACCGAFVTSLLMTPLDVVKVRMQSQPQHAPRPAPNHQLHANCTPKICLYTDISRSSPGTINVSCRWHAPTAPVYTGTWSSISTIFRTEGPLALWRGLSPTLVMSIPATIVYFIGYESMRDSIHRSPILAHLMPSNASDTQNRQLAAMIAGAAARVSTATLISPIELVRTRMQAQQHATLPAVLSSLSSLVRVQGVRALYRGLTPTLWRDVPFSAAYWLGYEAIRMKLIPLRRNPADPSIWTEMQESFIAGAGSGTIAAILTTPFDVAKTRIQVATSAQSQPSNLKMLTVLQDIAHKDGIRGLTRGLGARVAKVSPACAIMISSYEVGKRVFGTP